MNMLAKALTIAITAHKGQTDKGGFDYINHPVFVALNMQNEKEKIVALLHDVIEDTDVTINDLKQAGFDDEILEAIQVLTRPKNVDYEDYIKIIKKNKLATKVKIADLKHNSDKERLSKVGEREKILFERYKKALEFLSE